MDAGGRLVLGCGRCRTTERGREKPLFFPRRWGWRQNPGLLCLQGPLGCPDGRTPTECSRGSQHRDSYRQPAGARDSYRQPS